MNKVIIFTNTTGNVSVCIPTGEISIEEVQQKDIPKGINSYIVPIEALPTHYDDFFNAWEQVNGKVSVNIEKAKELTKQRLRKLREPLLVDQDILYMKALEQGIDTSSIIEEKNRLRNITNSTDTCSTLEELRNLGV